MKMFADIYLKQTIGFRYQIDINISEYFLENRNIETVKEIILFYSKCEKTKVSSIAISTIVSFLQLKNISKEYIIDILEIITNLTSKEQTEDFIRAIIIKNFDSSDLLNELEHRLRDKLLKK